MYAESVMFMLPGDRKDRLLLTRTMWQPLMLVRSALVESPVVHAWHTGVGVLLHVRQVWHAWLCLGGAPLLPHPSTRWARWGDAAS